MKGVTMTVEQWKELLREVGLSDVDMEKWHTLFEEKYPRDHHSFLEWLNIDVDTIAEIRGK